MVEGVRTVALVSLVGIAECDVGGERAADVVENRVGRVEAHGAGRLDA